MRAVALKSPKKFLENSSRDERKAGRCRITNLYKRGYPANYVMTLSGHKSIQAFQRYLKTPSRESMDMPTLQKWLGVTKTGVNFLADFCPTERAICFRLLTINPLFATESLLLW